MRVTIEQRKKTVYNKNHYRKRIAETFRNYSEEKLNAQNSTIVENLISLEALQKGTTILLYHPLDDEVDIIPVAEFLLSEGKSVCFPVCEHSRRTFHAKRISSMKDDFTFSQWQLNEPTDACINVPRDSIDLSIIPGRAFDSAGNRIGRGLGYYDNFLRDTSFPRIGVCYSFQLFENVPSRPYDIPLDIIVTDNEIITINS